MIIIGITFILILFVFLAKESTKLYKQIHSNDEQFYNHKKSRLL